MNKTKIIVDSTFDMSEETRKRVVVVPLTVRFETEEYIDGVTITRQEFYEKLIESDVLPTTSQATPFMFCDVLDKETEDGSEIVLITLSSKLSGTYQSAMIASYDYEGKVYLVDSNTSTIGGGIISIKPVIEIKDGEIGILGKARGSKAGNNLLNEEIERGTGIDFDKPILLGHSWLSDVLLQKYVKDSEHIWKNNISELCRTQIGSVVGTHAGPGAVAAAYFEK